jgi:hypothetical protein
VAQSLKYDLAGAPAFRFLKAGIFLPIFALGKPDQWQLKTRTPPLKSVKDGAPAKPSVVTPNFPMGVVWSDRMAPTRDNQRLGHPPEAFLQGLGKVATVAMGAATVADIVARGTCAMMVDPALGNAMLQSLP